jgi:hypothetical protein
MVPFAMNILASVPSVKVLPRKQLSLAIYIITVGRNQKSLFPAAGYCAFIKSAFLESKKAAMKDENKRAVSKDTEKVCSC